MSLRRDLLIFAVVTAVAIGAVAELDARRSKREQQERGR